MAEDAGKGDKTGDSGGKPQKKLRILLRTFGCQMNMRDSEFTAGVLAENGFKLTGSAQNADVVLFNSCSVRKHAEDRLFSNIAALKKLKLKKPGLVIGLMGCTAQSYKEGILRRAPLVDVVCGPGNEADLPGLLKEVLRNRCPVVAVDRVDEKRPELFPGYRQGGFKAYVSISEGCENFCSYCIVPYVRGRERSRDPKDIIKEVKDLAARGFKEITLLGQNVNSYADSGSSGFIRLLEALNKIKGIERVRFMTSHPKDASAELFRAMRDLEKVCEHLHLPLQSGSNRILKFMNRGYTRDKYLKLAEGYRKILPEGSLTTDLIAGFPSETEKNFRDTLDLVKKARFDNAYIFKYSARPPAKSAALKDDVPDQTKQERLKALLDLQRGISLSKNKPLVGKTLEILVDGYSGKESSGPRPSHNEIGTGRARANKVAVFNGGKRLVGKFIDVKITSVTPHALKGRIVR